MLSNNQISGYVGCVVLAFGLLLFASILWCRCRTNPCRFLTRDLCGGYVLCGILMVSGMRTVETRLIVAEVWHTIPLWWHLVAEFGLPVAMTSVAMAYQCVVIGHWQRTSDAARPS